MSYKYLSSVHDRAAASYRAAVPTENWDIQFTYTFENFFHPFVGELIARLNQKSLPDMLDPVWQDGLKWDSLVPKPASPDKPFDELWKDSLKLDNPALSNYFRTLYNPTDDNLVHVNYFPREIDVSVHGPYANYNWELFFHIPLTIAVHLSKMQRFAEAQRWFHLIFDPTSTDHTVDPPMRFWKFLAFRNPENAMKIDDVVRVLSTPHSDLSPEEKSLQDDILNGYDALRNRPFQPHAVARTRPEAYQYSVVIKYLDNLIAWGDNLYQQNTVESINEATQLYVLAANILGERPQEIPPRGDVKAKTFAQLRKSLGPIGDAFVDLESQFPFNLAAPNSGSSDGGDSNALFGIGRTLYFCIPRNDKLLGYWDTVADRLFKIRHCMNIAGVVRPLALFDPPIDPGMLVKAAAAGIDISSIVNAVNQPVGPVRCLLLVQKALELAGDLRSFGNAVPSVLEKGDAEQLALLRQSQEVKLQQMSQEVRLLQWKSAQETTTSLLTSRATALERLHYYQRLLGLPADPNAPDTITLDRRELTEENFDEAYTSLVSQYDKPLTLQKLPNLNLAGDSSPGILSGYSGSGRVFLSRNEDTELNTHLPAARDGRVVASAANTVAGALRPIPTVNVDVHFWGIGAHSEVVGGSALATVAQIAGEIAQIGATWEQDQAGMASRYAAYERRADEWLLQYNLAAHEVMQIGRQILTSLIAEQIAKHEYDTVVKQISQSQEVLTFLQGDAQTTETLGAIPGKFTTLELYSWMQGEIFRLYYDYYRFAFDVARRAERILKLELMRPEVDAQDFISFNYWDGGRKGLLSGEALYLDVKRMEMAYHDNNKRELELTKHVSLRQLNPVALLTLKATGSCQVTIPEWLFDLDGPGHYMRRIKSVALSIPSVVGPYTSVNCTLSLLRSSLRKSPDPKDDKYERQVPEDDRFVDYIGAIQSVVTSTGQNDSGMFETNLRDERFLPFEGAGAESTWKLDLPKDYRAFDYDTISDVILHIRYTARQGVDAGKVKTALDAALSTAGQSNLALLFNLRHDFPTEWAAFANSAADFTTVIRKDFFPYFVQGKPLTITGLELYDGEDVARHHLLGNQAGWDAATADLNDKNKQAFTLAAGEDAAGPTQVLSRTADAEVFLIVRYTLTA